MKCNFFGYDEHSPGYVVQDLQTRNASVARKMICKERGNFSPKTHSELGINDFPDIEEQGLRQNTIETEVRNQATDSQTNLSDQAVSHGTVWQQLKREGLSRESDSEAK